MEEQYRYIDKNIGYKRFFRVLGVRHFYYQCLLQNYLNYHSQILDTCYLICEDKLMFQTLVTIHVVHQSNHRPRNTYRLVYEEKILIKFKSFMRS